MIQHAGTFVRSGASFDKLRTRREGRPGSRTRPGNRPQETDKIDSAPGFSMIRLTPRPRGESLTIRMQNFRAAHRPLALAVGLLATVPCWASAQTTAVALSLKPGQEITFAVAVDGGRVALGPARLTKPGPAQLKEGEIAVAVVKHGLSPYADVTATEKTSTPIDFVATGLIGDIKIDEIVLCGRLDAPAMARIASGVWRISLNSFTVHPGGEAPRTGEGGLGCPS